MQAMSDDGWIFNEHWDYRQVEKRNVEKGLWDYERDSIHEIRKKLKTNGNFTVDEAGEVLEYLQKISQKLNRLITTQKQKGDSTWHLEQELRQVSEMYQTISTSLGR